MMAAKLEGQSGRVQQIREEYTKYSTSGCSCTSYDIAIRINWVVQYDGR